MKDGETAIEKATDTKGVDDAVTAGKQKMDDIYNGLAVKKYTGIPIQRVDGLVVGSRELTFYIPKVDGQRIESISVTNPDTGQTLYWLSNSIKVDDTGTLNKVTFTNPDNLKLVNDPKNVGKVF
ncbi:hypothetical protein, partial [Leuconostoc citreum]|uniref:hypothetical protein n=1 Tax=Leuconostoc citreum TaxID=33964 RepID=UPI0032DE748E